MNIYAINMDKQETLTFIKKGFIIFIKRRETIKVISFHFEFKKEFFY